MTSNANAFFETSQSRDTSNSSPLERRTTSSTLLNRFSTESTETAESSTAASKRSSLTREWAGPDDIVEPDKIDVQRPVKDGRGSHRSHKSRASGGFLLSNAFKPSAVNGTATTIKNEQPSRHRHSTHEPKGKAALRSPDKKHTKHKSDIGLGIGNSSLGDKAISNSSRNGNLADRGDSAMGGAEFKHNTSEQETAAIILDVDSAQIVNLALNLSESRRNAARRNISTPLPSVPGGIGESIARR